MLKKIHCDNPRLQASLFRIPDCHLLVINTYFPCDLRSASSDFIELTELLGDLESLISNVEFTNILISGDLNCHFQRNSKFTTIIKHWLDEYNLQVLWSLDDDRIEPVDYTFINTSIETTACSTIDPFVVSPRMVNGLLSAGVVHDTSNVSNHSPIYAKFEVGKMDLKTYEYTDRRKVLWGLASDEAKSTFRAVFEDKLSRIHPPNECTNINCTSDDHRNQL